MSAASGSRTPFEEHRTAEEWRMLVNREPGERRPVNCFKSMNEWLDPQGDWNRTKEELLEIWEMRPVMNILEKELGRAPQEKSLIAQAYFGLKLREVLEGFLINLLVIRRWERLIKRSWWIEEH